MMDCLTKFGNMKKTRRKLNYGVIGNLEFGVVDNLGANPKGSLEFCHESRPHVVVFTHKTPKFDENHTHVIYTDGRVCFGKRRGMITTDGVVQWESI
jgi:hypothetical protein